MFGKGNPAPRPGASLQQPPGAPQPFQQGNAGPRPGALVQQLPSDVAQPFQQGVHSGPGPGRPIMQHLGYQSGPRVYQTAPMRPHLQSGVPNMGMYAHGSQQNFGNNQGPYYPPVQHNSQERQQLEVHNLYHVRPPISSLPPPPPLPTASHVLRSSESLIPPPPSGYIMERSISQPTQPSGHYGVQHLQSPQDPLLSSVVNRITQSERSSLAAENRSHSLFTNPPPPPPHSCASPVPPACSQSGLRNSDVKELTSAVFNAASESPSPLVACSGGCPDPVKTNDVEATNELMHMSRNNDSFVTVGGLYNGSETCVSMANGSSRMNSKSEILRPGDGSSSQHNSSTVGNLCSTNDSDVDMEDVILNLVEDLETNDSRKGQNPENPSHEEILDAKQKLGAHICTPASSTRLPGEGVMYDPFLGQPSSMKTRIKVKQGHASDNSTEKLSVEDVSHAQPANDESKVLQKVEEPNLLSNGGSNNHCTAYEESNPVTEFGKDTETELKISSMTSVSVSKPAEVSKRDGSKENLCDESQHPSLARGRLKPADMTYKHGKSLAEDTTGSSQLKVDEFGRLAKNVSSDSDSDDRHYDRKRGRRGRSRSISPFDRRRKTPVRRRYSRSRSRSHSSLRRRSRGRSPGYRRPTESVSDRRRRDKIQTSICFNFRDGKCHRGSSCRFLHHESDKSDSSKSHKVKHLSEATLTDRGSNIQERLKESLCEKGSHRGDASHGSHQLNSTKVVHPDTGIVNDVTNKIDAGQRITVVDRAGVDQDDHIMGSCSYKREDVGGETAHVLETSMPQVAQGQNATNLPGDSKYEKSARTWHPYDANGLPSLVNFSAALSSKDSLGANHSAAVTKDANVQPQKSNISNDSLSVQNQILGTPHLLKTCDPSQDSVQPPTYAILGFGIQSLVAESLSQVPSSVTTTPFSGATTGHCMTQLHSNLSSMQPSTSLPHPFIPGGGPSYNQISLHNQPSQYNPRPVSSWTSLPPPPPRSSLYADTPKANISTSGNTIPYHFEPNQSQRTDVVPQSISGPHSGHLQFNSHYGGNHHYNYLPSVEAHRRPFMLPMQRPDSLFLVNSHPQQTGGLHIERNQMSAQVVIPSTFHVPQITSFIRPPATETFPSCETACHVSSQSNSILNNTSLNDPRNSASSDSRILGLPGKIESSTIIITSADLGVSGISEFEHSRTSAHFNTQVPASDRPLASFFSQPLMEGAQGEEAHVFREKPPSSTSIRNTGQIVSESGGDQYDPLLDSLDKSPNSLVNSARVKKQCSDSDSDNMLRDSGCHKPLDVEETNRKKESEGIASLTSSDNEEFSETADAEVGPLENESVNNLVDIPNRDSEVAISETYPDKKSKDSRSMKLFKSAIANFVKEVLKPSWRQGNMSKEAFKTIVKKTVEKVSGAMKGHRYPKSHAKINQYIDSSERKLRKLVMGYVDKYVKV